MKHFLKKNLFIILTVFSTAIFFSCSYESTFDFENLRSECGTEITLTNDNPYIVVTPQNASIGMIFYPGALVSYESYLPLMIKCAKNGIACFIIKMPEDFAFMNMNAALHVQHRYPQIENWYISGHSLGGAMAGTFLSSHYKNFDGIIFLASYSTSDLKNRGLEALSIFGSLDGVLNRTSYAKYKKNMPENFTELVIEGGNHAGFANYGVQDGDNASSITSEEQQTVTAEAISSFCK